MVKLYDSGVYLIKGSTIIPETDQATLSKECGTIPNKEEARKGTIAYSILAEHNTTSDMDNLKLKFDALASHDITYVGIIQTAKASGLDKFPVPYVLTNCHNTLCAVGGTINEDDHIFGLSAAKKYGGIYLPPHMGVIHQYMREVMAGCGKMILGSDSHTRYGALGTMAIGEGGGELVKQLLSNTYDVTYPGVVGIYLTGKPNPGIGPQDVALAIIGAVFKNGYVKNKVMEFVGPGVASMSTDYRNGVDVMTTETTCLTSIWRTDADTKEFLEIHGREEDYKELNPADIAYYDGMVYVDLSTIKSMIALPFHPSNTYEIETLNNNLYDILRQVEEEAVQIINNPKIQFKLTDKIIDGKLHVDQGIIAGCAGGNYNNIMEAAEILKGKSCGQDKFALSVYPSSQPVMVDLVKHGAITELMQVGATIRTAFCGPCFGAGDTPFNQGLSIRHTTRNFPSREGSKPGNGQIASVALMDARSIAATAANGGILTAADSIGYEYECPKFYFDRTSYDNRVYNGFGKEEQDSELTYGPNIKDWPEMPELSKHMLIKVAAFITDPVTTTDELIPSGETSSFRSNPLGLAEFTLSRRVPEYVAKAKEIHLLEKARVAGEMPEELEVVFEKIKTISAYRDVNAQQVGVGSVVYATKPGDGSAREQAASCQRVLGASANIAREYATKRYRSNLMNWGMVPFLIDEDPCFGDDDYIFIPNIKEILQGDTSNITAYVIGNEVKEFKLSVADMTDDERKIIDAGCLINFNRNAFQNK